MVAAGRDLPLTLGEADAVEVLRAGPGPVRAPSGRFVDQVETLVKAS